MSQLLKLESFRYELAVAETLEQIKLLDTKAAAIAEIARKEKLGKEKQDEIGLFRLEIEQKKGADFYFGSISAIFALFTRADVGVTQNRLYQVKIVPGKPYQNKTCTIKVGPMYRKRGNRDNSLKKVGI